MPTWPSPNDQRLGTPDPPAIRSTRASHFVASLVRFRFNVVGGAVDCTIKNMMLSFNFQREANRKSKSGNNFGNILQNWQIAASGASSGSAETQWAVRVDGRRQNQFSQLTVDQEVGGSSPPSCTIQHNEKYTRIVFGLEPICERFCEGQHRGST
jgi:hypothetical protein